jgi:gliding motility-associated-like protein
VCGDGIALDLFAQLGGSPDAGGSWSGPSAVVGGSYDPVTMDPGAYTYTLTAAAPCVSSSATVTVTESAPADAGSSGTLTVCDAGAAVSLLAQLGGSPDAGGSWSGPSPVAGGNYDPAAMDPGVYTYTVAGTAPCANASATVTVTETSSPDAGTDGSATVCGDGIALDLFAQLGGSPDAGGSWSGPSAVVGGSYDPVTMSPGVYTYTVSAAAPCSDAIAQVVVAEEQPSNPGVDASIDLCPGAAAVNLFTVLGGSPDAGGTWTHPDGTPFDGIFDSASDTGGEQSYILAGSACPDAVSIVTVNILPGAYAGEDASITVCSSDPPFALVEQLGGTPGSGGAWSDASGSVVPAWFTPGVSIAGAYSYVVPGTSSCPSDDAVLTIAVSQAPLAGVSGTLTFCSNGSPQSLFDGLAGTLDAGGTWAAPDGSPHGAILDPVAHAAGVYTYLVAGDAPCPSASSTVLVVIHPVAFAGEDGSLALCASAAPMALLDGLGGSPQAGGYWIGPDGVPANGVFDPGASTPGTYTYTVLGSLPCVNDSAVVLVAVATAANAGLDSAFALCSSDPSVDLFASLGGSPDTGGTWTGPAGPLTTAVFDPAVDASGDYTYTVTPASPCPQESATVSISVVPPAVASFEALSGGECAPVEIDFSHGYTGNGTCTWFLGDGQVVEQCAPFTHIYAAPGSYDVTLIVDAGNGCGADTVTLDGAVTVYAQPTAAFGMLPEAITTLQPTAFFSNASTGAADYAWLINGQPVSEAVDLQYTFPAVIGDTYGVCLLAYASAQCADTVCRYITLEDGMVLWVPNTFTPNEDARNEGFVPVVVGIDERYYRFEVFDRWGLQVFGSETPGIAWDGRLPDGSDAPSDVYVWQVRVKDAYSGDRVERIGHVTLLR